jgi:hypothetical protein
MNTISAWIDVRISRLIPNPHEMKKLERIAVEYLV